MLVLVNTDHNIEGRAGLTTRITSVVEAVLSHRASHITRVEVHVSDENGDTKRSDTQMRCTMEARLEGRTPLAVTTHDATVDQAVEGAARKLVHLIDHTLGRAHDNALHGN
jgi:hypothetical protein